MWHDVSELPKEYKDIVVITEDNVYSGCINKYKRFVVNEIDSYNEASFQDFVVKWCYQEDLIKQAIGEN